MEEEPWRNLRLFIFLQTRKKQGALWKKIHFLAKEKNYAEEHCKGFC